MLHAAAAFQVMAPGMVDQNAPHHLGRNGEKMGTILPLHVLVIHQAHVGFVDQSGGLQAIAGAFASHVAARQAVEFVINDWGQLSRALDLRHSRPGETRSLGHEVAFRSRRPAVVTNSPLRAPWSS